MIKHDTIYIKQLVKKAKIAEKNKFKKPENKEFLPIDDSLLFPDLVSRCELPVGAPSGA